MSFLNVSFRGAKELTDKIEILDAKTYAKAISDTKVQLVDVRSPAEYNSGHIKNAVNIDFFDSVNFERSFDKMSKERPVYLYCRSGSRSRRASHKLARMGFVKIYDLKGGYLRWK
ncbi:rhodanese-like domain-containing protein [Ulvibacterium marinum]|uniref:Rhodanese-like domain-containing protein n=1 Tax=Ulvibacterium marinum TaxID=2419782 RepID=A0A3B0C0X2_9FLAO|nr:rhodanese-like domain-containing protein [Ulvibacterium marinum]RKN79323.1 rhodanese-like domain-containing protein [Ulvibacterium marinum]